MSVFTQQSGKKDVNITATVYTIVFVAMFAASLIVSGMTFFLYRLSHTLPTIEQLGTIQPALVSQVFSRDSSLIHEFSVQRRFWADIEEMPQNLLNATIAIEDRRFYKHWGVDLKRIAGAVLIDVMHREYVQGASTITQQLARNVFLTSRRRLIRKIREAMTAVKIEHFYTKEEILELYLNQVYLGAGVYGVEAASQQYFSKSVSELTLNECATIAGVIQLPEYFRPDLEKNHTRSIRRRNTVLHSMYEMGFISRERMKTVHSDSLPNDPAAKSFRVAPYFMDMVREYISDRYGENALYKGGLKIYTTLDLQAQDSARTSTNRQLASLQKRLNRMFIYGCGAHRTVGISYNEFMAEFDSVYNANKESFAGLADSLKLRTAQAAVVAIDVKTGAIRVLIGGGDYEKSKFNRAMYARRQPGSAFKPFVYTAALEHGYTPATEVMDQPVTIETPQGTWRPQNYEREFSGPVTISHALAKSINLVAVQVIADVGIGNVISCARKMGLSHRLNKVPALAIGACQVTPVEIASAYSVYANQGKQAQTYFIEQVVNRDGTVLEKHEPQSRRVLSETTAYLMVSMMRRVVDAGTGISIRQKGFRRSAGGKTGTTNDYTDAWFVGYTPQYACAVWVGVDERRSLGHGVTGAHGAIPIWAPTMIGIHQGEPVRNFSRPDSVVQKRVCDESHKLATRYCPETSYFYFAIDRLPDTCDIHTRHSASGGSPGKNPFGSRSPTENGEKNDNGQPLMF